MHISHTRAHVRTHAQATAHSQDVYFANTRRALSSAASASAVSPLLLVTSSPSVGWPDSASAMAAAPASLSWLLRRLSSVRVVPRSTSAIAAPPASPSALLASRSAVSAAAAGSAAMSGCAAAASILLLARSSLARQGWCGSSDARLAVPSRPSALDLSSSAVRPELSRKHSTRTAAPSAPRLQLERLSERRLALVRSAGASTQSPRARSVLPGEAEARMRACGLGSGEGAGLGLALGWGGGRGLERAVRCLGGRAQRGWY